MSAVSSSFASRPPKNKRHRKQPRSPENYDEHRARRSAGVASFHQPTTPTTPRTPRKVGSQHPSVRFEEPTWHDYQAQYYEQSQPQPPVISMPPAVASSWLPPSSESHVASDYSGGYLQTGHRASVWKVSSKERIRTLRLSHSAPSKGPQAGRLAQFYNQYTLQQQLAAGAYGVTYTANEISSGRVVVVKRPNDVKDVSDFEQLRGKSSPYVVRTFDIFSDGFETYVVMEYCAGGNLFNVVWDLFDKEGHVSVGWCSGVFKQVLQGLYYLHLQFDQSHNDLKPENILLECKPQGNWDVPRVMIGDFGCAAHSGDPGAQVGDPRYRAPETFKEPCFTPASDAWSCGVTLFEMLTGILPFLYHRNIAGWASFQAFQGGALVRQLFEEHSRMVSGEILEADCSTIVDPDARELTRMLLQVEPAKRISVGAALYHPWFQASDKPDKRTSLNVNVCRAHVTHAMGLKLREVVLMLVASKLQGAHLTTYQQIWAQWDANNDGVLDKAEFAALWGSLSAPFRPTMSAAEVFDAIDVDANGTLDFDEFVAFMFDPMHLNPAVTAMYFRSAFSSLCGPGGAVSRRDFETLFSVTARPVVAMLFDEMDTDQSGFIDFEEFSQYVMRLCEP